MEGQEEVVAFLRGLANEVPVETHISLVFRGADTVWKLKKAVRLTFLDFTEVAVRERYLRRELELNAPSAPALYRDVVAIVRRPDGTLGFAEGDVPEPLDWVLRMARIPEPDFLDVMAREGRLTGAMLDELADTVAAYHARCPRADADPVVAMTEVIAGNARACVAAGLPEDAVQAWRGDAARLLAGVAERMKARAAAGFVRRGHGDLHLGNLCLWRGRPAPFDALEFDEALGTIDTGYDLAFLLMDLDCRLDRAAANRVMNRYVARTGDAAFTGLLPLFLSLRAMVLAHVRKSRGDPEGSGRYLRAALAYLRPAPAVALAVGGLQGSGKSTLARALAPGLGPAPGALVCRSDEIRKRRNGVAPEEKLPNAAYTDAETEAVFAQLAATVGVVAGGGHAVIADATFIDPAHRRAVHSAASEAGVPFLGVWLEAPLATLEQRVTSRTGDASDATAAVLRRAAKAKTIPPRHWIRIESSTIEATLARATEAVLELQGRPAN